MTDVPRDPLVGGIDDEADAVLDDLDEDENKDTRFTKRRFDQYVEKPGELSDSEDEDDNAANGIRPPPHPLKRRNEALYRGLDTADSGIESGLATPHEPSSVADEDIDMTGDTRMDEAPEPDTGSPSAAEPESRAEEAGLEPEPVNGGEQPTSAPMSPKAPEDTAMEDVQPVPAPEEKEPAQPEQPEAEPTQPEQQEKQEQPEQPQEHEKPGQPEQLAPEETETPVDQPAEESKPTEEPAAPEQTTAPASPPKVEAPEETHPPAKPAKVTPDVPQEPARTEEQEPPKEPAPEKPEEAAKQEE